MVAGKIVAIYFIFVGKNKKCFILIKELNLVILPAEF
jgi:hypothetical protein